MNNLLIGLLAMVSLSAFASTDMVRTTYKEPTTSLGDSYHAKSDKNKLCKILTYNDDAREWSHQSIKVTRYSDSTGMGDYISKLKSNGKLRRLSTSRLVTEFSYRSPIIGSITCYYFK